MTVKAWARARGIYGSTSGYPGGSAWAAMTIIACERQPRSLGFMDCLKGVLSQIQNHKWEAVLYGSNCIRSHTNIDPNAAMVVPFPYTMVQHSDIPIPCETMEHSNMCSAVNRTNLAAILREIDIVSQRIDKYSQTMRLLGHHCTRCSATVPEKITKDIVSDTMLQEVLVEVPHPLFLVIFVPESLSFEDILFIEAKLPLRLMRNMDAEGTPIRTFPITPPLRKVRNGEKLQSIKHVMLITGGMVHKGSIRRAVDEASKVIPKHISEKCWCVLTRNLNSSDE